MDRRDLESLIGIVTAFAGFLLLPKTLENVLWLFPAMLLIFIGLCLAIGADD